MRLFVIVLTVCVMTVFGDEVIPSKGLQMWLQADSVTATTDVFLATMRNMSNTRYAANQTEIKYRPLYIRDYIQNRPVVSLSDSRGFAFGTLRATEDMTVYVGYYHQVSDLPTEFRIETFNFADVQAQKSKNGFVMGVYDRMLAFHGEPGFKGAMCEFIMYDCKLTDEQDRQLRCYLNGRYSINFDRRYVKNSPLILGDNIVGISNAVQLKNKTYACAAEVVQLDKRRKRVSLELLRSYNYGQKWTLTIGTILEPDSYIPDVRPYLFVSKENVLYCFYTQRQEDEKFRIAFKYSSDEGYNWSAVIYPEPSLYSKAIEITSITENGAGIFVSASADGGAFVFAAKKPAANEPQKIQLEPVYALTDIIESLPELVTESFSITSRDDKIYGFFSTKGGFIYRIVTADGAKSWKAAGKLGTAEGTLLRNSPKEYPLAFSADNNVYVLFRNCPKPFEQNRDVLWLTKLQNDDDKAVCSQPQMCFYSTEFAKPAALQLKSAVMFNDGKVNAVIRLNDQAYFGEVKTASEPAAKEQTALLELPQGLNGIESYDISALPSLLSGGFTINLETVNDILDEDGLILKIGEDAGRVVLFTENRRFGIFITDTWKSAVLKSCRFEKTDARSLKVVVDGASDTAALIVDSQTAGWDDGDGSPWIFFSEQLGVINDIEKIYIPVAVHDNIKSLSVYYEGK